MEENEIERLLEEAEKLIAVANRSYEENWNALVHAPFDLAKELNRIAVERLQEARSVKEVSTEETMILVEQACEAAKDSYYLTLPSRAAEARGVWYRPTEKNREDVCRSLDRMQAAGFNELYLEAWFWGYTIYPSSVAAAAQVEEQHPRFRGWDPLEAFVQEAGKRGIAVHAWLDGFMVGVDSTGGPVLRAHPDWSAQPRGQADSVTPAPQPGTGYYWLDITNPLVRQYMLDIVNEMITRYGVAGINLDFMRFPHSTDWRMSYCFSRHAREAYQREHGTDPLGIDAERQPGLWQTWKGWLEGLEDAFVAELYQTIKRIDPRVIVSAAPEPGAESDKIGRWSQYVDVVIPQAYYSVVREVRDSVRLHKAELLPGNLVYSGIYPMYIGLGAMETIEQAGAVRDLDQGTVIFAFGQANDDTLRALRIGPWRTDAISTGMYPLRSAQRLLESAKADAESIYVQRKAVGGNAANEIIKRLDAMMSCIHRAVGMDADLETVYRVFADESEAFTLWLSEEKEAGTVLPNAERQLQHALSAARELLLYSRTKLVK